MRAQQRGHRRGNHARQRTKRRPGSPYSSGISCPGNHLIRRGLPPNQGRPGRRPSPEQPKANGPLRHYGFHPPEAPWFAVWPVPAGERFVEHPGPVAGQLVPVVLLSLAMQPDSENAFVLALESFVSGPSSCGVKKFPGLAQPGEPAQGVVPVPGRGSPVDGLIEGCRPSGIARCSSISLISL